MPCNDINGVSGGLLGECPPLDLGCLEITSGEPLEPPQTDDLPVRYDPSTGSLWIFRCNEGAGAWVEIEHTTLCDAPILDPTGVENICDLLFVPVTYAADGDCCGEACEERRIEMDLFSEQVKDCLELNRVCELDFLANGAVDGAAIVQLAACVDGVEALINPISLCRLNSIPNVEVDSAGSVQLAACVDGNEVLIEPISLCRLSSISAPTVDAAGSVELAACVDGAQVLIPPFTLCRLNSLSQGQVDAATSVMVAACVDDADVLIPVPTICDFDSIDQTAVDAATTVQMAACVDDVAVLIPPYDICNLNELTQPEVEAAGSVLMAACVDGAQSLIPVQNAPVSNTYLPVLRDSTGTGTFAYTTQSGTFIIMGGILFIDVVIEGTWSVAPSGNFEVVLPQFFRNNTEVIITDVKHTDMDASSDLVLYGVDQGPSDNDFLVLNKYGANGAFTQVVDTDLIANNNRLQFSGMYRLD